MSHEGELVESPSSPEPEPQSWKAANLEAIMRNEAKVKSYCLKLLRTMHKEGAEKVFEAFGEKRTQELLLEKLLKTITHPERSG